ncbi:MAG: hypothetical protein HQL17_03295 [Candidatus Omnitrophica bacterium]|nr:hypothetical protein [Candidatus Omnitrophota bacterium]
MRVKFLVWGVALFLLCGAGACAAQEISPEALSADPSIHAEPSESVPAKGPVQQSGKVQPQLSMKKMIDTELSVYLAVAKQSDKYCHSDACKGSFMGKLNARYVGEGACDKISSDGEELPCLAVKSHKCSSMKDVAGYKACQSILFGGPKDVESITREWKLRQPGMTNEQVAELIGIASGYYHFNMKACQKYLDAYPSESKPYQSLFACQIVFARNPEFAFKKAEADAVLFERARIERQPKLCYGIFSPRLRQMCLK